MKKTNAPIDYLDITPSWQYFYGAPAVEITVEQENSSRRDTKSIFAGENHRKRRFQVNMEGIITITIKFMDGEVANVRKIDPKNGLGDYFLEPDKGQGRRRHKTEFPGF